MSFVSDFKETGEVTEPGKGGGSIQFDFPTADKPLICKLVMDPRNPGKSCVKVDYFKHKADNTDKGTRRHPCRDSLGLGRSPEKDYFWELIGQLKDMKNAGKKDTPEYKALVELKKFFTPQTRGALYYVEPNSPKFKALPVGPMVFNRLFGRDKTEFRAAIPSLIKQMAAKNMTPFLDKDPAQNSKGWVKIWKTGENLATEYHMEVCTVEEQKVIDGDTVTVTKYKEYQINPDVQAMIDGKKELDLATFPDFIEFEKKKNVWTLEESEKLVEMAGDLSGTPERFLRKDAGTDAGVDYGTVNSDTYGSPAPESQDEAAPPPSLTNNSSVAPGLDDIPF